jgi:hypothetical protein
MVSLKVMDITLLRETLLASAVGLFAVTEGVDGAGVVGAGSGLGSSSFLQLAVNSTPAAASTDNIFFNFIIFVFFNSRCWRTDVNNFHDTKVRCITTFMLHNYGNELYNSHINMLFMAFISNIYKRRGKSGNLFELAGRVRAKAIKALIFRSF